MRELYPKLMSLIKLMSYYHNGRDGDVFCNVLYECSYNSYSDDSDNSSCSYGDIKVVGSKPDYFVEGVPLYRSHGSLTGNVVPSSVSKHISNPVSFYRTAHFIDAIVLDKTAHRNLVISSIGLNTEWLRSWWTTSSTLVYYEQGTGRYKAIVNGIHYHLDEQPFVGMIVPDIKERIPYMFNEATRCLVTGGAGFIGSHLCGELLQLGCQVYCVDNMSTGTIKNVKQLLLNDAFHLLEVDVRDSNAMEFAFASIGKIDYIFHLACPASPPKYQCDSVGTLRTCFEGTYNVLCHTVDARLIFSSTSEIYGDPPLTETPQREGYRGNVSCTGPRACYDEGKRVAETLITSYARQHGLNYGIVRIFNTYGPNMAHDDGRVVTNFLQQLRDGRALTLYGDGEQTRSFCYVSDLVRGLIYMAASDENGPINLGNPEELTIKALAELIIAKSAQDIDLHYVPLPEDDPLIRCPDITQAQKLLGWSPTISLREGLKVLMS